MNVSKIIFGILIQAVVLFAVLPSAIEGRIGGEPLAMTPKGTVVEADDSQLQRRLSWWLTGLFRCRRCDDDRRALAVEADGPDDGIWDWFPSWSSF